MGAGRRTCGALPTPGGRYRAGGSRLCQTARSAAGDRGRRRLHRAHRLEFVAPVAARRRAFRPVCQRSPRRRSRKARSRFASTKARRRLPPSAADLAPRHPAQGARTSAGGAGAPAAKRPRSAAAKPDPRSLEAAKYILLLTSLPADDVPDRRRARPLSLSLADRTRLQAHEEPRRPRPNCPPRSRNSHKRGSMPG